MSQNFFLTFMQWNAWLFRLSEINKKCSYHFRWGFCCLMSLLPNLHRNKLSKWNTFLWVFELQTRALGSHIFLTQNFLLIPVDRFLFFNTMLLNYSLMYSVFFTVFLKSGLVLYLFCYLFPLHSLSMAINCSLIVFLFHLQMQMFLMGR